MMLVPMLLLLTTSLDDDAATMMILESFLRQNIDSKDQIHFVISVVSLRVSSKPRISFGLSSFSNMLNREPSTKQCDCEILEYYDASARAGVQFSLLKHPTQLLLIVP